MCVLTLTKRSRSIRSCTCNCLRCAMGRASKSATLWRQWRNGPPCNCSTSLCNLMTSVRACKRCNKAVQSQTHVQTNGSSGALSLGLQSLPRRKCANSQCAKHQWQPYLISLLIGLPSLFLHHVHLFICFLGFFLPRLTCLQHIINTAAPAHVSDHTFLPSKMTVPTQQRIRFGK